LNLSEDQILALAPDEASKKPGKDLASPNKWVSKGINEVALWGEAQGSGSKPYQTQIDVNNIAFKCSCPSRKFPCKHALGLLLLHTRQPNLFAATEMPAWVNDWIGKRPVREEKKVEKLEKRVDEAAQAKRLENREKKVADGIEELLLWIKDIVRNGIINLPEKSFAFWEQMAKRMVDAQAPGLAGMVRGLGQVGFFKDGWQTDFIDQLLTIYLVINAFKNKDYLSPTLQQDVRTSIGFTQNQEEVKAKQGITDTWLVLAKQSSEDDNLTVERHWLHGVETGQYALVLQFLFRGQGAEISLTPGMYIKAELVYYPSVAPMRAIIKSQITTAPVSPQKGFAHWREITENEAQLHSAIPFSYARPYIIQCVTPVLYQDRWWLVDKNNDLMQINQEFKNIWKLLAISGGNPVDAAIIGKENVYEPIGVWENKTYKSL
jgi:hypothetical protein